MAAREEARRSQAQMRPGESVGRDGAIISGRSPSGALRGDVFTSLSALKAHNTPCPALSALVDGMRMVRHMYYLCAV